MNNDTVELLRFRFQLKWGKEVWPPGIESWEDFWAHAMADEFIDPAVDYESNDS